MSDKRKQELINWKRGDLIEHVLKLESESALKDFGGEWINVNKLNLIKVPVKKSIIGMVNKEAERLILDLLIDIGTEVNKLIAKSGHTDAKMVSKERFFKMLPPSKFHEDAVKDMWRSIDMWDAVFEDALKKIMIGMAVPDSIIVGHVCEICKKKIKGLEVATGNGKGVAHPKCYDIKYGNGG